jgi:hypothetical protein
MRGCAQRPSVCGLTERPWRGVGLARASPPVVGALRGECQALSCAAVRPAVPRRSRRPGSPDAGVHSAVMYRARAFKGELRSRAFRGSATRTSVGRPAPGDHQRQRSARLLAGQQSAAMACELSSGRNSSAMAAPSVKPGARRRGRRGARRSVWRVHARRVPHPRPRARALARRPSGRDACLAVVSSRHAACPRGQARGIGVDG